MFPRPLPAPGPFPRVDERDTIFSRARLRVGTALYESYYRRRPEHQHDDDRIRRLRHLAAPGTPRFRSMEAVLTEACFAATGLVAHALEHEDSVRRTEGLGPGARADDAAWPSIGADTSPSTAASAVKAAARFLGAADVGIAPLDPAFVYSHRGQLLEMHGQPVELPHRSAIVLVFPMREPWVGTSPELTATAETARAYQQAASACYSLARALRNLGAGARGHVDTNYLVICPPLAVAAGLGELGRNGILVHRTLGPGVRLGVVTTDLVLDRDTRWCHGVADFCRSCAKCAEHCPASAIPKGEPVSVGGAVKWPLAAERCYHYWRSQGGDCGVCVRVCPFTKADTPLHRGIRAIIRRTTVLNRSLLWLDDRVYGHRCRSASLPSPLERGR